MSNVQNIQYLYIDDGPLDESSTYAGYVMERDKSGQLSIEVKHPTDFAVQIEHIEQALSMKHGLILDLRLDQQAQKDLEGNLKKVDYRATSLAQEIRTRAAERTHGEFPILLWSFERWLQESFVQDQTSHDLFDLTIKKERLLEPPIANGMAQKMIALAQGYPIIESIRDTYMLNEGWFHHILGFENLEEAFFLDTRILENFDNINPRKKKPAHEFAFFLTRHLLEANSPLLNANVVAARLGIDITNSTDFDRLLNELFIGAKYTGIFSGGWDRWWGYLLEQKWNDLVENKNPLRSLSALKRVELLRQFSGLQNLVEAQPIRPEYSTEYWTVCQKTQKPIDPRDGFLLKRSIAYPWQEQSLVSLEAFESGEITPNNIDPVDRRRLKKVLS